jgi:GNAT superfamily N-acetyltransferase
VTPTVRPALAQDAAAIAAVRVAAWRAAYGPHLPANVWGEFGANSEARFARTLADGTLLALVALTDDRVIGYAFYGAARDDDLADGTGEIYAIYVHPDAWSTGAGRALMAAALDALGDVPVALWVLTVNERARRFYTIAGFTPDGAEKLADMLGDVKLPELRYRKGPLSSTWRAS